MRKYLAIFNLAWQMALTHRMRAVVWIFVDLIFPIVMALIFKSVYSTPDEVIFGLNYQQLIQYYIIVTFIKILVISHPSENMSLYIWNGDINQRLVQPINFPFRRIASAISWRLFTITIYSPVIIAFLLFTKIPISINLNLTQSVLLLTILLLAFITYWVFDFIFGTLAFWFIDISGFQNLKVVLFSLLSGRIIPPNFLPQNLQAVNQYLPFQYFLAFPVEIIQNQSVKNLHLKILILLFYLALFSITARFFWRKGLKRYSAVGS